MTATPIGFRREVPRESRGAFAFLLGALTVEMVFFIVLGPLLPTYVSELHLTKLGAGVLSASYAIGCGAAAIPAGLLVGRIGARPVTIAGVVTVGAACGCFALAHRIALLDLARVMQGVGCAALWAGAIAWLTTLGDGGGRGSLIGLALSAASFGGCLGPAAAALTTVIGRQAVFLGLAAVILALAAGGLLLAGPQAGERAGATDPDRRAGTKTDSLGAALASAATWRALAMVALPSIGFGVAGVLVPLRLHHLGVTAAEIAGAYLIASLLEMLVNPFVGRWYDRRGAATVLRVTLAGCVICALGLSAGLPSAVLLVSLTIVWPVFGSVWVPALAELTSAVERAGSQAGLASGLFNLCWAMNAAIGAIGGAQLARVLEAAPFIVLAVLFGAGARSAGRRRPIAAAA
jgi:DHA1 family multidrug resistance protein-like MFS transporter